MGVHTIGDLLHTYPYRHEDRTKVHRICDLVEGMQNIQLRGHIVLINKVGEGPKRRMVANFTDGTMISARCNLCLPGSSDFPASAS